MSGRVLSNETWNNNVLNLEHIFCLLSKTMNEDFFFVSIYSKFYEWTSFTLTDWCVCVCNNVFLFSKYLSFLNNIIIYWFTNEKLLLYSFGNVFSSLLIVCFFDIVCCFIGIVGLMWRVLWQIYFLEKKKLINDKVNTCKRGSQKNNFIIYCVVEWCGTLE
jgi:hypothetical protein